MPANRLIKETNKVTLNTQTDKKADTTSWLLHDIIKIMHFTLSIPAARPPHRRADA
jgi:hypothetical protein